MKVYLETDRLTLREFVEADAPLRLTLDSDPEVMRYIGPFALSDEEAYRRDIARLYEKYYTSSHGLGFWAAIEQASGEFLGWVCLRPAHDFRFALQAGFNAEDAELGYRFCRAAWGKGYATEASRALVRKAFAELNVPRVVAAALATNGASRRVLEKAGLRELGSFALPGYEVPVLKYALHREEYVPPR